MHDNEQTYRVHAPHTVLAQHRLDELQHADPIAAGLNCDERTCVSDDQTV
jgi:hypothetical protein